MPRRVISLLYACLICSLALAGSSADTCYNPDLTANIYALPCANSTGYTYCCDAGAVCLENGICLDDLLPTLGTCTDPEWQDPSCPLICDVGKSDLQASITYRSSNEPPLEARNKTLKYTLTYCEGLDWACSSDECANTDKFEIEANFILRDYQVASLGLKGLVTISPSNTLAFGSASTTFPNAISATTSILPTTTLSPITPCPSISTTKGTKTPASVSAVGAGLGVPLGLAAILFLGLFLLERRKLRKLRSENANTRALNRPPPLEGNHFLSPLGMNPSNGAAYPAPPLDDNEQPFSPTDTEKERPHSELADTSRPIPELLHAM